MSKLNEITDLINVELTLPQATLLRDVERHYEALGYLIGYMDMLNLNTLRNMTISLDIDDKGIVRHTSFTSHYRK